MFANNRWMELSQPYHRMHRHNHELPCEGQEHRMWEADYEQQGVA
jgi:hypothetical protein